VAAAVGALAALVLVLFLVSPPQAQQAGPSVSVQLPERACAGSWAEVRVLVVNPPDAPPTAVGVRVLNATARAYVDGVEVELPFAASLASGDFVEVVLNITKAEPGRAVIEVLYLTERGQEAVREELAFVQCQ